MTATHVGHTPPTTTDYRPHPESTDSEFNVLQQAYARRGVEMEKLRQRVSELTSENASLKAHIDTDHEALQRMAGWSATRTARASDDGPEVVYDWSQDEDAVEYKPPPLKPLDSIESSTYKRASTYERARLGYQNLPGA